LHSVTAEGGLRITVGRRRAVEGGHCLALFLQMLHQPVRQSPSLGFALCRGVAVPGLRLPLAGLIAPCSHSVPGHGRMRVVGVTGRRMDVVMAVDAVPVPVAPVSDRRRTGAASLVVRGWSLDGETIAVPLRRTRAEVRVTPPVAVSTGTPTAMRARRGVLVLKLLGRLSVLLPLRWLLVLGILFAAVLAVVILRAVAILQAVVLSDGRRRHIGVVALGERGVF